MENNNKNNNKKDKDKKDDLPSGGISLKDYQKVVTGPGRFNFAGLVQKYEPETVQSKEEAKKVQLAESLKTILKKREGSPQKAPPSKPARGYELTPEERGGEFVIGGLEVDINSELLDIYKGDQGYISFSEANVPRELSAAYQKAKKERDAYFDRQGLRERGIMDCFYVPEGFITAFDGMLRSRKVGVEHIVFDELEAEDGDQCTEYRMILLLDSQRTICQLQQLAEDKQDSNEIVGASVFYPSAARGGIEQVVLYQK